MKLRQWMTGIVLLALMALAVVGLVWTREPAAQNDEGAAAASKKANPPGTRRRLLRSLQTAQKLAGMAGTPEEQTLANEAEKIADHDVNLAFFDAVRTAQENPPPLSPEAKKIAERKASAQQTLKDDQDSIAQLTRKLSTAPAAQKDKLQDQIDVAQAQAELDQDEVDDATEDLE